MGSSANECRQVVRCRVSSPLLEVKTGAPVIVDEAVTSSPIGIDGPDDSKITPNDDLTDQDVHHNAGQTDLPVEGPQLTATQVVEEMPQFPGGLIALSQYLDEHIVFSGGAQTSWGAWRH